MSDYVHRPKDTSAHWYNIFEGLLVREVREETGLEIKNIRYLTSLAYLRSDTIPTIIVSLFADYAVGEVQLCPALVKYAWVSLEEARDYELIEGIYEELEMLDRFLKEGTLHTWTKE